MQIYILLPTHRVINIFFLANFKQMFTSADNSKLYPSIAVQQGA
jgi:hypothetical protein